MGATAPLTSTTVVEPPTRSAALTTAFCPTSSVKLPAHSSKPCLLTTSLYEPMGTAPK